MELSEVETVSLMLKSASEKLDSLAKELSKESGIVSAVQKLKDGIPIVFVRIAASLQFATKGDARSIIEHLLYACNSVLTRFD